MVDLDAPVWKTLQSAAYDFDPWFRKLLRGEVPFRDSGPNLFECLCHQLSWYNITPYVLPHLAALCRRCGTEDQIILIGQLGAVIATETVASLEPDSEPWREFHEGLDAFRSLTRDLILNHMDVLRSVTYESRQMFALGALAVLGDRRHAYDLFLLSGYCWEEGQAACECGWYDDFLPLAEEPDCLKPAVFARWDKHSLDNEGVWFSGLLTCLGDEEILPVLPLIYGTGVCPKCGKQEPYWNWLDRYMEEC